jgi:hypothetical protein
MLGWFGKNVEGIGHGLFESTLLAFAGEAEKLMKDLSKSSHPPNSDLNLGPCKYFE